MYIPRLLTTLVIACALSATGAGAVALDDGKAAYDRKDYTTALSLLRPLAEQGNAEAETYIGLLFYYGQGTPKDYAEALKWLHLAAAKGFPPAQNGIGNLYFRGEGVEPDYSKAPSGTAKRPTKATPPPSPASA
jgi:TPR repeat protein